MCSCQNEISKKLKYSCKTLVSAVSELLSVVCLSVCVLLAQHLHISGLYLYKWSMFSYSAQSAPHRENAAGEMRAECEADGVRTEQMSKHKQKIEKKKKNEKEKVTGSPQWRSCYSWSGWGSGHALLGRTRPRPERHKLEQDWCLRFRVKDGEFCVNESESRTLWPSFLISSIAWLRRSKMFFFTLCLPGGFTQSKKRKEKY